MHGVLLEYERIAAGATEREKSAILFFLAKRFAEELDLSGKLVLGGRLETLASGTKIEPRLGEALEEFSRKEVESSEVPRLHAAHLLGELYDRMFAVEADLEKAKKSARANVGSFFTPRKIAEAVAVESFLHLDARNLETLRVLDPAAGGGAFLLEAGRRLEEEFVRRGVSREGARAKALESLHGVDISELAASVLETALVLAFSGGEGVRSVGNRIAVGNALTGAGYDEKRARFGSDGVDFRSAFPTTAGFEWIIGNPPWVAYQGRATRPLEAELRAFYRRAYRSFSGYPTLQAMFVERAAELGSGVIALLVPSSLSDLEGYAAMRVVLTKTHAPLPELPEFGQDAFPGVVQPCFALVAVKKSEADEGERSPFRLREKGRSREDAKTAIVVPEVLVRLREGERLPAELFGELGFQTNRVVSSTLLSRGNASVRFSYPLLEGKNVREFFVGEPRVFLEPNRKLLEKEKIRLRPETEYARAKLVIRQTASFPIAALHTGKPFRNSLLAGYENEEYSAALLVGLLNSTLFRAYHLASQRDARQVTFPQLKVGHLRALPAPLMRGEDAAKLEEFVREVSSRGGIEPDERVRLDELVFRLFRLGESEGRSVVEYFSKKTSR